MNVVAKTRGPRLTSPKMYCTGRVSEATERGVSADRLCHPLALGRERYHVDGAGGFAIREQPDVRHHVVPERVIGWADVPRMQEASASVDNRGNTREEFARGMWKWKLGGAQSM